MDAVSEKGAADQGDIDFNFLKHVLGEYEIDGVLHFAASSQVGESMVNPGNTTTTMWPVPWASWMPCGKPAWEQLVFSSTAAVRGTGTVPITGRVCR